MPKVELIFDLDCPNVSQARLNLFRAFTLAGIAPQWTEWDRNDRESPDYAHRYGSPSILIDGKDIAGEMNRNAANCCRVYLESDESNKGVPSVKLIATALSNAKGDIG
jgi:hypothetical protein